MAFCQSPIAKRNSCSAFVRRLDIRAASRTKRREIAVISEPNQEAGMGGPREDALRHTSDFHAVLLGMAGHDLRQPLQVIQSAYDWLGPRISSPADRAQLERGERAIAKLGEQLDRLVGVLRWYEHTSSMVL